MDHLEAWWDFDDENPEVVSEYFGRFPGAFIDNNISGTLYEVTYAPGLSGSALSFPGNAWVRTTASASSLGIPSNRPRTISLWIQAQENEMNDAVIYGMGNLSGNSGGNWTGWGLRNIWYNRISSFYNHQNVKNDFGPPPEILEVHGSISLIFTMANESKPMSMDWKFLIRYKPMYRP